MRRSLNAPVCLLLAIAAAVVAGGCKESTPTNIVDSRNTPVLAVTANSLSYVIDADRYSASSSSELSFTSDTVAISLASGGYVGGYAVLTVSAAGGVVIFSDSITSNKAIAITQSARGIPVRLTSAFSNFTGKVSFVVSRTSAVR